MSCLRSRGVVPDASKIALMSAPARVSQSVSSADSGLGWRARSVASAASARVTAASLSSPGLLQRPGHQPVLRLAGVVLAAGAAGLVAGPFDGQLEGTQPLLPGGLGSGERLGGGRQRGRLQHGEHLADNGLLDLPAADALAVGPAAEVGALGRAVVAR